ncbi:MAG: hypothetical protein WCI27_08490, partial [Candidatus Omnitrophota bacterium]
LRRNRAAVQSILKEFPETRRDLALSEPVIAREPIAGATPSFNVSDQEKRRIEEQRAIVRKEFEDGVDRFYNDAVMLYNKKRFAEALESFRQVDSLIKGYKKTAVYMENASRLVSKELHAGGDDFSPDEGRVRDIKVSLDVLDQNAGH